MSELKDSGNRREFITGSVRDIQEGKGRFDLIPYPALKRVAQHFEAGCKKYGERNWEKGQPLSAYFNSATRHLNEAYSGATDEDHEAAAVWNCLCYLQTSIWIKEGKLPKGLDDRPSKMSRMEKLMFDIETAIDKDIADAESSADKALCTLWPIKTPMIEHFEELRKHSRATAAESLASPKSREVKRPIKVRAKHLKSNLSTKKRGK
jgi:hypothetical protein